MASQMSIESSTVRRASSDIATTAGLPSVSYSKDVSPKGNVFDGLTIYTNALVTPIVTALPMYFARTGWALGLTLLILSAPLSAFSMKLYNTVSVKFPTQKISFFSAVEEHAPILSRAASFGVLMKAFIPAVAYLQFAGDAVAAVLVLWSQTTMDKELIRNLCIVGGVLVVLPFCLCGHISTTTVPNVLGVMCMLYVVFIGVFYADVGAYGDTQVGIPDSLDFWGFVAFFPKLLFIYSCHHNAFPVAEDMKRRSNLRLQVASSSAIYFALGMFVLAAVLPYATYGNTIQPNFLMNVMRSNVAQGYSTKPVEVAQFLWAMSLILSFPVQIIPAVAGIFPVLVKSKDMPPKRAGRIRTVLSLVLVVIALSFALGFHSVHWVLQIPAQYGNSMITFILPCILYYRLTKKTTEAAGNPQATRFSKLRSVVAFNFSIVLVPIFIALIPLLFASIVQQYQAGIFG